MFQLFVDPAHAGRGIGHTLLSAAHDALRAAGCKQAYLFTHEQNERALAVYASAGYRPDGSIRESDFNGTRYASCASSRTSDAVQVRGRPYGAGSC